MAPSSASDPPTPHRRQMSLPLGPLPLASALHATPLSSPTTQGVAELRQGTQSAQPPSSTAGRRFSAAAPRSHLLPTSPRTTTNSHDDDDLDDSSSGSGDESYLPPAPLNLARLAPAVVPSRQGSVLSRGLLLKADYRFTAAAPPESSSSPAASAGPSASSSGSGPAAVTSPAGHPYGDVAGASHVRDGGLGVWGVAQPTATGIRSLLALLGAKGGAQAAKGKGKGRRQDVAWFMTREEPLIYIGGQPYVLREASHPTETYSISDRAENLEEIEARLKNDILREAARYGGLVLVHSEPYSGPLRPSWVSVSPSSVLTARELFVEVRHEGFSVRYHRTPVARDQSPQDGYLDTYAERIRALPTRTQLVFNCGAGVVRSTFAMSVALLVRRRMLVDQGRPDPYGVVADADDADDARDGAKSPVGGDGGVGAARRVLRQQSEQARRDRSLLRLMHVLSKSLPQNSQATVLSLLSSHSNLLENLRAALLGNFDIILSLLSTLDDGTGVKKVVDAIVDDCDAMVNLRESIVQHRVRYASLALLDERTAVAFRQSALAALERYFFLVAFASFLSSAPPTSTAVTASSAASNANASDPPFTFSAWLKRRPEVKHMITRLRKEGAPGHFFIFAPVQDLSAIAKADRGGEGAVVLASGGGSAAAGGRAGERQGERIGEEWAEQIIRARSGIILRPSTILKNDQWLALAEGQSQHVRGAINFRRVPGSKLYGLSQPTEEGIRTVVRQVSEELGEGEGRRIVWIGVREEPLVNINGTPYVLRQQAVSLRNVKSYSGISAKRLELLEARLKDDVLSELTTFEGRILVASEADNGSVNPLWEAVEDGQSQVKTMREVMDKVGGEECGNSFTFIRVPVTAEKFPEFQDLRDIIEVVTSLDMETSAVIVNDQLGRGRTTRTLVVIKLLQDWMRSGGTPKAKRSDRQSYVVINNLLRVVRNGFEVKNAVDAAITACGEPFDLLESIENARQQAEDSDGPTRAMWIARGIRELRGYFFLILFMCFLNECRPSTWREMGTTSSYETWVKDRPVFRTIQRELDDAGIEALTPLSRGALVERGTASDDEVADFVAHRDGRILSAYSLLKSDFFSGLQKMSLPERVDGAPNFRRVPLGAVAASDLAQSAASSLSTAQGHGPLVYGSGMPTVDGLRHALEKMSARETKVLWQSLREEPVLFVSGRPHVLRLFDRPLENVITTGVTTATVEAMEVELKKDLLREREKTGGKVLLHDEIEENGSFTVTAMWEEIQPNDILTPREVYTIMQNEGFKVDYERLPVTDEQSPIPGVFSRIERRMSSALTARDKENFSAAWNCQMGRGRTTTGMVACALVYRILFDRHAAFEMAASYIEPPEDHNLHWDGREAEPLLQGEYKLVLQLVGVLKNGKLAKRLADKAIDDMEAVQNLRLAIHSFVLRVEAAEEGSKKRAKLFDQALNYLYRYATLIVFANFLLDKASHLNDTSADSDDDGGDTPASEAESTFPSFETYLAERPEIKKILTRRTLD